MRGFVPLLARRLDCGVKPNVRGNRTGSIHPFGSAHGAAYSRLEGIVWVVQQGLVKSLVQELVPALVLVPALAIQEMLL